MSELIRLENVSYTYDSQIPILKSINLTLNSAEILGVIGPNGGGKTTLLKIILGLLPLQHGAYYIKGKPLVPQQIPRHFFGHVPQKKEINTLLPITAYEFLQLSTNQNSASVEQLIDEYSLHSFIKQRIAHLSGGQLQRLLMARALLNHPQVLVLDEPSTGLDTEGIDKIAEMIQYNKQHYKQAIIVVDHNIRQILHYSDRILCINKTHHWHDTPNKLTNNILNSIYHCEYEHELIHEKIESPSEQHHYCHQHQAGEEYD